MLRLTPDLPGANGATKVGAAKLGKEELDQLHRKLLQLHAIKIAAGHSIGIIELENQLI